ncbi:MAG: hypothetical protein K6E97_05405 [Treponema sp.]|nr:hypothetical protein [Treponema sp.]
MKKLITFFSALFVTVLFFTGCKESIDILTTKDDMNLTDGNWKFSGKIKSKKLKTHKFNSIEYDYSIYENSSSSMLLTIEDGIITDSCVTIDNCETATFVEGTPDNAITNFISHYKDSYWTRNGYTLTHETHSKDSHDTDLTNLPVEYYISVIIEDNYIIYTNKDKTKYKILANKKDGYILYDMNYLIEKK